MLKRALIPTCKCGQPIEIPKGRTKAKCQTEGCGMTWERGPEGYWAKGLYTTIFTPFITSPKACTVKTRAERYRNYPKARRKKR